MKAQAALLEARTRQLAELRGAEKTLRELREKCVAEGALKAGDVGGEMEEAEAAAQSEEVIRILAMLEGYLVPTREALSQVSI